MMRGAILASNLMSFSSCSSSSPNISFSGISSSTAQSAVENGTWKAQLILLGCEEACLNSDSKRRSLRQGEVRSRYVAVFLDGLRRVVHEAGEGPSAVGSNGVGPDGVELRGKEEVPRRWRCREARCETLERVLPRRMRRFLGERSSLVERERGGVGRSICRNGRYGGEALSTDNALFPSTVLKSWMENARYRRFEPRKPPTTALSHPLFP